MVIHCNISNNIATIVLCSSYQIGYNKHFASFPKSVFQNVKYKFHVMYILFLYQLMLLIFLFHYPEQTTVIDGIFYRHRLKKRKNKKRRKRIMEDI